MSWKKSQVIDCRSDTVTVPCKGMREAMASAQVGDDVYREDPTVHKLEQSMAEMLGKESGLFVPSGTMGNLICVMSHCWGRGLEILLGDRSHIHVYEQGGIAQIAGVHHRTLSNLDDGTFSLDELRSKFRIWAPEDPHESISSLVCIENSHNKCGGKVLPLSWIDQVGKACQELKLPLHCDGARLFNSAAALGVPPRDLVAPCDSVSVCLSKGLGAPVGSVIVGNKQFITRAIRVRKSLGGAMRQVGIVAAAGLYALQYNLPNLGDDHVHAKRIAKVINTHGQGNFVVDEKAVDTNLVFVTINPKIVSASDFVERLLKVDKKEEEPVELKIIDFSPVVVRIACHLDISHLMVEQICSKLVFVLNEYSNKK